MEMTPKRRLLAAIRGEEVDHIPFSPFLAYYFESLPQEIQKKGQLAYLQEMGADPLLRGFISAYSVRYRECSVTEKTQGGKRYITVHTPKGDLYSVYTYVAQANTWFLTEHPVKGSEDFPAAIAFYQDMEIIPNIQEANRQVELLGEDGLHIAILGANMKSAYQHLVEHLIGTENLIYLTKDDPEAIHDLVDVIAEKNQKTVEYTAESHVEACLSWEDSSTTNLNPSLYREFILPELSAWNQILKEAGKLYIQHACGHIKDLLLPMAEQGVAAIESISPPPTGNVTMEQAAKILPPNVALIGGIEPVQFLHDSTENLLVYVESLCEQMKGRGFVLANSDSCPPGVAYEKFKRIAQFVKKVR